MIGFHSLLNHALAWAWLPVRYDSTASRGLVQAIKENLYLTGQIMRGHSYDSLPKKLGYFLKNFYHKSMHVSMEFIEFWVAGEARLRILNKERGKHEKIWMA